MPLRTISIFFDEKSFSQNLIDYAVGIAVQHKAHVAGIFVKPFDWPYEPHESYVRGREAIRALIEHYETQEGLAADVASARFQAAAERHGVGFEFRTLRGVDAGDEAALHSLHADLVIVGHAWPGKLPGSWSAVSMLLGSGVPFLIVPEGWSAKTTPTNVTLAWNASRVARRAIADAMPLLSAAQSVRVVVVNPEANPLYGAAPGADIALLLARQDINVTVQQLQTAPGKSVADAISADADENGSDLIVIGAYGHSRSRELFLGGVTRSLLKSATVPLLIAH
ncbi:hypothetical protein AE618_08785 [Bosea vaviloviae]|uniref:UspA domain-containing protein n=2 Tax=Bosea vaviloviae TaxID=1526658 RepID=A0A0N0MBW2_9HYPH|nr:hypothetical protein AE618_08785 [Bosea vaviloviae]